MSGSAFTITDETAAQPLAGVLRRLAGDLSWSQAKRLIATRRVAVNGTLCLDEARRLKSGDVIEVYPESRPPVPREQQVHIVHIDSDLVVVDKPAGVQTLRRPEEAGRSERFKDLQPTLDELLQNLLPSLLPTPAARTGTASDAPTPPPSRATSKPPRVFSAHRLDRETSGLMLFALSRTAQNRLIDMFATHQVERIYVALVLGHVDCPRTIESLLVRDRGDGLRGSAPNDSVEEGAQRAITHIRPLEHIGKAYTLIECRLETGRTHQIRIHLAEAGHMLCGEKLYTRPQPLRPPVTDPSGADRHALHSSQLRFIHPIAQKPMRFDSPLPGDFARLLARVRDAAASQG